MPYAFVMTDNLKPGIYEHYKGKKYEVIGMAKHSESLEDLVVYKTLYENSMSELWVRPLKMFQETVMIDGIEKPRFKFINNV
jgi:hypothetical protein